MKSSHRVSDEFQGVCVFIAFLWAVFAVSLFLPSLNSLGLEPRTFLGVLGIITMPFLHGSLAHILGNSIPLFVLLMLLAGSKAKSWEIVVDIVLLGGVLLWLFGRGGRVHIGASLLIFGLIAFLIVSGILERRFVPLLVAVVVAFLYGTTLLAGVLPSAGPGVSWDGHLFGAVAGSVTAYGLTRPRKRRR